MDRGRRGSFRSTLTTIFVVLLGCTAPFAAVAQTTGDDGSGYFGAPVIEYTRVRGQDALAFGGRGGWYVTPAIVLGGGLYGTVTEVDAAGGGGMNAPGPLDLKLERFGLELEYHVRPAATTHLTFGAFVGGAAARHVLDGTNEQHGETDFLFALAPALGVERTVTGWMHLNLSVSYRFVTGAESPGSSERRLRGPAVDLALKFGRFD